MKTSSVRSLIFLLMCMSAPACQAGHLHHIGAKKPAQPQILPGYAARTEPIKAHEGQTHLQIYNRKTSHIVWSGVVGYIPDAKELSWSADHTAAAMIEYLPDGQRRLLIWRAGQGIRVISRLPASAREEQQSRVDDVLSCDSVGVAALSPDKRRVLLLASPGQGNSSVGLNQLWCLTLRTRHLRFIYKYAYDSVIEENSHQHARWLNSHRIAYVQRRINKSKGGRWEYVAVTHSL